LIAIATAPASVGAQSPGHAVADALRSVINRPGGCFEEPTISRVAIEFFPQVQFFRTECVREHGDSTSALVALDADSVLYLLVSDASFKFLMDRHPPGPVDSGTFVAFTKTALEMTGRIEAQARIITTWSELPDSLIHDIQPQGEPLSFFPLGHGAWEGVVHTASPGYYGDFVVRHDVLLLPGNLFLSQDSLVYRPARHP